MGSVRSVLIRVLLVVAVVSCLAWQAARTDLAALQRALRGDVYWNQWILALSVYLTGVVLTFLRWGLLVRALGIPFPWIEATRLGFVGYFMQFFALGTVGGDVFKAVLVARYAASQKLEAVSTILVDRLLGMVSLVLLACVTFFALGGREQLPDELYPLTLVYLAAATAGVAAIGLSLYTPLHLRGIVVRVRPLRMLMPIAVRLDEALLCYRNNHHVILLACGLGMISHGLQAAALYFVARGLSESSPNLIQQISMWSIAAVAGALPLTPAGLGTFDAAYTYLFNGFASPDERRRWGLLVTILFRVMCLVTASLGLLVYTIRRSDFRRMAAISAITPNGKREPTAPENTAN